MSSDEYKVPPQFDQERRDFTAPIPQKDQVGIQKAITNVKNDGEAVAFSDTLNFKDGLSAQRDATTGRIDVSLSYSTTTTTTTTTVYTSGPVYSVGNNIYGPLGLGVYGGVHTLLEQVHGAGDSGFLMTVSKAAGGDYFSVFLLADGTVWFCGKNDNYQGGLGNVDSHYYPVQVPGLAGVIEIACGVNHTLCLLNDGTVWAFGSNFYGQLGDGTHSTRTTPVQVSGITSAVQVSAGSYSSYAVLADGSAVAWGRNTDKQLGDGTSTQRNSPVTVSGLTSGVTQISGGGRHAVALLSDGSAKAWGYNAQGGLGDGTVTLRSTPVSVSISDCVSVAAGLNASYFVKADGTVWACGQSTAGSLGDGSLADQHTPVQLPNPTDGKRVQAYGERAGAAVRTTGGTVWTWGRNADGQLGDNTTTERDTPVQMLMPDGSDVFPIGSEIGVARYHTLVISYPPELIETTSSTTEHIDHALLKNRGWRRAGHEGLPNTVPRFDASGKPRFLPIASASLGAVPNAVPLTDGTGRLPGMLMPADGVQLILAQQIFGGGP